MIFGKQLQLLCRSNSSNTISGSCKDIPISHGTHLAIVGVACIFLSGWCALLPSQTSGAVGFTFQPGAGQSEFMTVYGGLQLALGIAFLWPLYRPTEIAFVLFLCLLVHGCLVVFQTTGFVFYTEIPTRVFSKRRHSQCNVSERTTTARID